MKKIITALLLTFAMIVPATATTPDQFKSAYVQDMKAVYDGCLEQSEDIEVIKKVMLAFVEEYGVYITQTQASVLTFNMCVSRTYEGFSNEIGNMLIQKGEKV